LRVQTWPRTIGFEGDKVRNTPFLGGKVKLKAHVVKFFGMLKIRADYVRDTLPATLTDIFFAKILPASLLSVSAGIFQRALVDDSGMIRIQMGIQNRSENDRSTWDALYDTTP
jgi:hypothetical protein